MGAVSSRPVGKGEPVRYGDVFAWVNKETREVDYLVMFVGLGEVSTDWCGVYLSNRRGPMRPRVEKSLVSLLAGMPEIESHQWERVL